MNGRDRTLAFLKGEPYDHIPFHPLVMQFAAQKIGVNFRDYCRDYREQSRAMIEFAFKYGSDWLHPSGYAYCEAEAYGTEMIYPDNALPFPARHFLEGDEVGSAPDVSKLRILDIESDRGMMNRVQCIAYDKKLVGNELFIAGHCEGPLAEYTDLRGANDTFTDLLIHEDAVKDAMAIITENAKNWITLQVQAGAECISIGEAMCSQVSEEMYLEMVYPLHKQLVDHVKSLGVYSKFHICGNSSHLVPHIFNLGTNILDIDYMVKTEDKFTKNMAFDQCFCGNINPVQEIRFGTPESITEAVKKLISEANGKIIMSGGCEIPLGTPDENYSAFKLATETYGRMQ